MGLVFTAQLCAVTRGDENGHMLSVLSLPLSLSLSSESDDGGKLDSALLHVMLMFGSLLSVSSFPQLIHFRRSLQKGKRQKGRNNESHKEDSKKDKETILALRS